MADPTPLVHPPALGPGDRVAVIAPSSGFSRVRLSRGLATLRTRYDVQLGASLEARDGYLAGTDDARAADLASALQDPSVRAIVAARGGFGATRLLDRVQLDGLLENPKWLVGFSDVTALHALWTRAGVASVHGPMVCSLPEAPAEVQRRWFDALEGHGTEALEGTGWGGGQAHGRLLGGNLAVLTALCGTPFAPCLDGSVLLLEDIGERPYRVDRMLTTLRQSGLLRGVAAIVLGGFTQCEPGDDGTPVERALQRNLLPLGVPIVGDLPVGHVRNNHALVLGDPVAVDGDRGRVAPC